MEDETLIKETLNGKTQYYAEIVKRYQDNVANLCYKMCGNRLDIEEVTQQVFVELYYSLPKFRFESKLSTFIYRITVNIVSKMLSREKRYETDTDSHQIDELCTDSNIEQNIIRDERTRQLRQAIGQLKQEQRTALVLYTFNDLSYKDIADVMQISLSKVESLIFRAKKNLQKRLTP